MLLNTKLTRRSGPGARLALAAVVALSCASIAFGVYDLGLFELEGNAVDDPGLAGDDWDQIYCDHIDPDRTGACAGREGDPGVAPSNALVLTFLTDPVESSSDDIFDGARDSLDIRRPGRVESLPRETGWQVLARFLVRHPGRTVTHHRPVALA